MFEINSKKKYQYMITKHFFTYFFVLTLQRPSYMLYLIYYENEESHFVYHLILHDIIIQLQ